ncbi:hypothetical protein NKI38_10415 [Mesorhizobium sp. M0621]
MAAECRARRVPRRDAIAAFLTAALLAAVLTPAEARSAKEAKQEVSR